MIRISDKFNNKSKENISCSGNGFKVPQYGLDKKTSNIYLKHDKDGVVVTHSLYDDIQTFKDTNSLERILKTATAEDLANMSILCNSESEARSKDVDYSNIQNIEQMKDFESKLNAAGMSAKELNEIINKRIADYLKKIDNSNKEKTPLKQENKEVIENGEKDKK